MARGKSKPNIEQGKGVTAGRSSPSHAVSMIEPFAQSAAEHAGVCEPAGPRQQRTPEATGGMRESEALHQAGRRTLPLRPALAPA